MAVEEFSKWPQKSLGIVEKFKNILKVLCGIKHRVCYIYSFYYKEYKI